ncbi:hypothetical protein LINGRAHAP2_LOCUS8110 [Linum grandiflorum]
MPTDSLEVHLNSSANEVWGAVTAATTVFPRAMRGLYQQIKSMDGDGYPAGSMRTITFGHLFNRVVDKATEKILDVDHEKLTIESTFTEDGSFIPVLFNTLLGIWYEWWNDEKGKNLNLKLNRFGKALTNSVWTIDKSGLSIFKCSEWMQWILIHLQGAFSLHINTTPLKFCFTQK